MLTIPFITSIMSCLSSMCGSSVLGSNLSLLLNFILPTSERSYLSSLKNKLLNKVSAESFVGGSPGLIILYISTKASILLDVGSTLNVLDIYGPLTNSLMYKHLISVIPFSLICSKASSSISVFAFKSGSRLFLFFISPVSLSIFSSSVLEKISSAKTLPIKNSSERDISLAFELVNSLICLAVILLPAST